MVLPYSLQFIFTGFMSPAFQYTVKLRIPLHWTGGDWRRYTERYEAGTQVYGGTFTTDTPCVSHLTMQMMVQMRTSSPSLVANNFTTKIQTPRTSTRRPCITNVIKSQWQRTANESVHARDVCMYVSCSIRRGYPFCESGSARYITVS